MSSTFVADTADDRKSDNTLIIIVNNDGTISVDPDTLQNIIANPEDAPVSVIRVGTSSQGDENSQDSNGTCDSQGDGNPHVSLTVEGFYSPAEPPPEHPAEPQPPNADPPLAAAGETPLDPFLEMDPEQLQRLETALQSEQAKQILGENVTAMLDMLSVDEDASKLKETIRMDHCYTSLSPSSAPSTTPSESTTTTASEVQPAVNHINSESQKTTSFGRGAARGTRGRGRGPGRPRKDVSSARSSLSYRGASSGRGSGRGPVTGTDTSNNLVMVQQIRHITAPPPNSPSASLVPLIKPLILPNDKNSSVHIGQGLTFPHKKATAQPSGGSQLVSLASKAGGHLTSGGQQRVIVTNNTAVPLHELSLPTVVHTSDRTIVQNSGVSDSVVTSNNMVVVNRSPPTQVTSTALTANTGQAKVLVAKMPSIPPQLLGAQPTSRSSESHKIPLKNSSEDDDEEFANFPRDDETEESEDDDDPDTDDDYRARLTIRQRGSSRGGRGNRGRGIRSRGSLGRGWDRSRGVRGGARRRGGSRGGRGAAKSEDVEQVHKLDSEMAAALAAMDKAQDSSESAPAASRGEHIFGSNSVVRTNLNNSSADAVLESSLNRKPIRSYGRSQGKRKSDVDSDAVSSKSVEPPAEKQKEEESKPVLEQVLPDTKSATKNAVMKQTSVADSPVSPVSPVPPGKISVITDHKQDIRKNYPKRENRKPPAHLAEALGPALFSTPDIIRRVNAGSDHKSLPPTDLKKEETRSAPKKSVDHSIQEVVSSPPEEKGEPASISITEGEVKNEASSQPTTTVEEQLPDDVVAGQNKKTEVDSQVSHHHTNSEVVVPVKDILVSTADTELQKEQNQHPVSEKAENKVERTVSTRPIRKRNIHMYADLIMDRDLVETLKHSAQAQVKDKRKLDDSRASQGRSKGRRRRSSVVKSEVDELLSSSDEESWNSEDDPDRLWCICKKPHNNRFMICCDICEDWFHGKCVGITKAMGQQMENKGLEWSCPNCSKKNESAEKSKDKDPKRKSGKDKDTRRATQTENQTETKDDSPLLSPATCSEQGKDVKEFQNEEKITGQNNLPPLSNEDTKQNVENESNQSYQSDADVGSVTSCIVCKKEARQSSIYCSHACILKHAEESQQNVATAASVTKSNQSGGINKHAVDQLSHHIPKPQTRVIVYERRTGKLLSGKNAPTLGNLKNWLKENPTFEVVKPSEVTSSRVAGKLMFQHTRNTTVQTPQANLEETQQKISPSQPKPSPQQKSILSYYQPANQAVNTEASQQKQGVQNKHSVVQSKPAPHPQKVIIKSHNITDQPKGQHVLFASVKAPKIQKQTILIPPEQTNKLSVKTVSKPAVSSAKSEPKSPVSPPPSNKGHIQNVKPLPINALPKVSVTPTVKESDKTPIKKVENKRFSSDSTKKEEDKEKDKEKEKEREKEKDKEKNPGPEPIRLNVRKTLKELLQSRIQECSDLHVTEEEIQDIALNIEEEMHSYFRDTGIKYKSKYRSLVFNIKDPKNLTLFRKIAEKSVTPHQLVRLSPEELANQELAQWREREAKHQIEMIKKNELDLLSLTKTYVMKTHKGEQVIEADEAIKAEVPELVDPSTVPDVSSLSGSVIPSTVGEKKPEVKEQEKTKDKIKDSKDKDRIKKEDKDKNIENEKSKHEKKSSKDKSEKHRKDERESSKRDHHHHHHHGCSRSDRDKRHESRDHKEKHKRSEKSKHDLEKNRDHYNTDVKKEKKADENDKEEKSYKKSDSGESDEIIKHKHSDHDNKTGKGFTETEEYKPSVQFVKVESQDIDEIIDQESSQADQERIPDVVCIPSLDFGVTIWQGFVNMPDVSRFYATVQLSSGDVTTSELPSAIEIVGRIMPDTVWDYISKMKKTGTKEIIVLRFTAANDAERIPYMTLYSYLNARNRMGVVGSVSRTIKDFYIMPLSGHTPLPQILLPIDGTGFEDIRPHLLLGILVRTKRKRLAPENEYVAKAPRHGGVVRTVERSYTPPLPGAGPDAVGSLTPPHPPPSVSDSYTPPISPTQSLYAGSQQQLSLQSRWSDDRDSDKDSTDDQVRGFKKSGQPYTADDDDAPYSPGESDDYQEDSGEDNMQSPLNTKSELERKMEELNRKIEEQKQQIQTISSAIVSSDSVAAACGPKQYQVMKNYTVIGDEKVSSITSGDDENEAYSPSRSFTPPPSIPFIGPSETQSMLPSLPSNISIPSNLHEILASIKKRETDLPTASGSRGIDLKTDPIVQNYANTGQDVEIPGLNDDMSNSPHSYSANKQFQSPTEPPLGQSATSVVPALLSLSTPVVHPHSIAAQTIETRSHRDPRQRSSVPCDTSIKSSGSTLSKLSDDDLIKKAAEMMEMEHKDSLDTDKHNVYPQSMPPSADSLHSTSSSVGKIPAHQPLPPGVEDEDYGSYGTPFVPSVPSASGSATHNIPMPPPVPPSTSYQAPLPAPVPYTATRRYTQPPLAYNLPRSKEASFTSSFSASYSDVKTEIKVAEPGSSRKKRKFHDDVVRSDAKRSRGGSPIVSSRDTWDNKAPVPLRGRFNMRGRGFVRGNRGFMRKGRGMGPSRGRWGGPPPSEKHFSRRSPRYDASIRSEWDMHIKDFEQKHRERTRDKHRERERMHDRTTVTQRSSRSSSRRNRDNENSDSS
ncbi:uncharacterized protein LOC124777919 [Schistocerca piceifrons]|uniref:uncharacterized protein LOC124777919 n=1 Tax=Schistocerca piceifrons TaxID=274613 RepID=UPI001F5F57C4|nr:uncharacterized protein LOC124777919 [Schistocerca piceifrons]